MLLRVPGRLQDIEAVDPEYYKNLKWTLENDITGVLDLSFTVESDYFGKKEQVELKPGGAAIKVTEENKREYVDLATRHRMTTAIRGQINSFLQGFWDLIPKVRFWNCVCVWRETPTQRRRERERERDAEEGE
jgi:E3 ubiquitin-protein ligase HUWE1